MANSSIYAAFERMWQNILVALNSKADSEHDHDDKYYTETEIDELLNSFDENAEPNVIEKIKVNGTEVNVSDDKSVDINVPTDNSELNNGAGYITANDIINLASKEDMQAEFDELKSTISDKSDRGHTHEISNINGLSSELQVINDLIGDLNATKQNISDAVGKKGTKTGAEVFNYNDNTASGLYSHAEGYDTFAFEKASHAEGINTEASGEASHAEGSNTIASGNSSHAEGVGTDAIGQASHAEGAGTEASGSYSHAEGYFTKATKRSVNVIGEYNKYETGGVYERLSTSSKSFDIDDFVYVINDYTIDGTSYIINNSEKTYVDELIFGNLYTDNKVTKSSSINEFTERREVYSNTDGNSELLSGYRVIFEKSTLVDLSAEKGEYVHIVGNGTGASDSARSNAHTLTWEGDAWYAGDVYVSSKVTNSNGKVTEATGKKLATEEYTDTKASAEASAVKTELLGDADESHNTLGKLGTLIEEYKGDFDVLNEEFLSHGHNYAGSSSYGGSATSAEKLNTDAGSATQPVYFSGGVPVEIGYTIEKSVPSDAKFTDTTYSVATETTDGLMSSEDKVALGDKQDKITGTVGQVVVIGDDGNATTKTLAPTDIDAATASHTHAASDITSGFFAGQVNANAEAQTSLDVAQVRNIYAGTSDTITSLPTGTIYLVYES